MFSPGLRSLRLLLAVIAAAFAMPSWASAHQAGEASADGSATESAALTIARSVIASGGALDGASGPWQLAGTIGQLDSTEPATLAGGGWTVTGGFWTGPIDSTPPTDALYSDRFEATEPD